MAAATMRHHSGQLMGLFRGRGTDRTADDGASRSRDNGATQTACGGTFRGIVSTGSNHKQHAANKYRGHSTHEMFLVFVGPEEKITGKMTPEAAQRFRALRCAQEALGQHGELRCTRGVSDQGDELERSKLQN